MSEWDAAHEARRLAALQQLDVLDTEPEAPFENIVALVRTVLAVPMASVTLVDAERQWFKARSGIADAQTPRNISFCTHAVEQDAPLVVPDATADVRFAENPLVTAGPGIRSYAGVQLTTADGFHVGTLCAIDTCPREYTPGELTLLSEFAKVVVNELELHRRADRDHLTGALTRQAFTRHAAREIARIQRYAGPASLILFDLDHFKRVNDELGHAGGDAVLRSVAQAVQATIRPTDYFGRIGGEEFAILLPQTASCEAAVVAERLRTAIATTPIWFDGQARTVTASFGIADWNAAFGELDPWIAAADAPLYRAKHRGRNRCETAEPTASAARAVA